MSLALRHKIKGSGNVFVAGTSIKKALVDVAVTSVPEIRPKLSWGAPTHYATYLFSLVAKLACHLLDRIRAQIDFTQAFEHFAEAAAADLPEEKCEGWDEMGTRLLSFWSLEKQVVCMGVCDMYTWDLTVQNTRE